MRRYEMAAYGRVGINAGRRCKRTGRNACPTKCKSTSKKAEASFGRREGGGKPPHSKRDGAVAAGDSQKP
jgi:hypothetical protein